MILTYLPIVGCLFVSLIAAQTVHANGTDIDKRSKEIELRGVLKLRDNYSFSIQKGSSSMWRKLNQQAFGYTLSHFSASNSQLTLVDSNGVELKIQLAEDEDLVLEVISDQAVAQSMKDATAYDSISPETLRDVHLASARDKVKYQISPRTSANSDGSFYVSDSTSAQSNTQETEEDVTPKELDSSDTLTELEKIALVVYEKHHVPVREAPTDVDVVYKITPR